MPELVPIDFDPFGAQPSMGVTGPQRAFLDAVAGGESPGYNVMYGGGKFSDFSDHPRQNVPITSGPNMGRTSSAAGRYQFLGRTWDEAKSTLGLPDFSPQSQDKAALWLAERDYKSKTGRDLWKDVESANGDPNKLRMIGSGLSGTWTSLPGGIEPNRATGGFGQRFAQFLSGGSPAGAAPASGGPMMPSAKTGGPQLIPVDHDPFAPGDQSFDNRFAAMQPPQANSQLQQGLERQATQMTTGPATSPVQSMAINAANVLPAAMQGTSPNVEQYKGNLISTKTYTGDDGSIWFDDPQTGQHVITDNSKHVAIRDPADNTVKVYARSDATNENPAVGAARVLAPGLASGAVTARPGIAATNKVLPTASDIFSTSKPHYREFTKQASRIEVPAETAKGIGDQIRRGLDKANFIEELAPQVYKAVGILDKGEPVTLDALQNVKRVIGKGFNSPDKNVRDAAAVASKELSKVISQVSPEAAASLKTADDIHSTALAVQDLQRKGSVADLRAGRAGYGGNAVNTMRQALSPIVQRATEGKSTLFKPDEIAAIREIVEGTPATNAARLVGQLSPNSGLGVIRSAGAGGTALAAGASGGMALAIPAIGAASNKLATVMTGRQIDHLRELVAKRSPAYTEAVAKAVQRYEKAQIEFGNNPSPNTLAAYISGSRALSAGLTRDGIKITSGDLIRAIQSQRKAAAEDE